MPTISVKKKILFKQLGDPSLEDKMFEKIIFDYGLEVEDDPED